MPLRNASRSICGSDSHPIRQPRFWRTESPALGEVISVWLILTLVMAGSLLGLGELLGQFWFQSPTWLSVR